MKHPPRAWRKAARRLMYLRHLRATRRSCSLNWWAGKLRVSPQELMDAEAARIDPRPLLAAAQAYCDRCGRLTNHYPRQHGTYCGPCLIELDELWDEDEP